MVIFDEFVKIWREIQKIRNKKRREIKSFTYIGNNVLDLRMKQEEKIKAKSDLENNLRFNIRTFSVFLLVFVPLAGLSSIGSTVSYYNESESSVSNTLQAGTNFPIKSFGRVLDAGTFNLDNPETLPPTNEEITEQSTSTDATLTFD